MIRFFIYGFASSIVLAFPLVALGVMRFTIRRSFDVGSAN